MVKDSCEKENIQGHIMTFLCKTGVNVLKAMELPRSQNRKDIFPSSTPAG